MPTPHNSGTSRRRFLSQFPAWRTFFEQSSERGHGPTGGGGAAAAGGAFFALIALGGA
jgi:hypothetical protein